VAQIRRKHFFDEALSHLRARSLDGDVWHWAATVAKLKQQLHHAVDRVNAREVQVTDGTHTVCTIRR
jgi:hypothetical protein